MILPYYLLYPSKNCYSSNINSFLSFPNQKTKFGNSKYIANKQDWEKKVFIISEINVLYVLNAYIFNIQYNNHVRKRLCLAYFAYFLIITYFYFTIYELLYFLILIF